jgi:hypothetical protein
MSVEWSGTDLVILPGDLGKVLGLGAVLLHVLHAGVTEHLRKTARQGREAIARDQTRYAGATEERCCAHLRSKRRVRHATSLGDH